MRKRIQPERLLGKLLIGTQLRRRRARSAGLKRMGFLARVMEALEDPDAAPIESEISDLDRNPATLLLRAMISAAACDGHIDDEERAKIMERCRASGLEDDEREFLDHELGHPWPLDKIVTIGRDIQMGTEIYAVSLMAIIVDTRAEESHMQSLAEGLGLNDDTVGTIHETLDVAPA